MLALDRPGMLAGAYDLRPFQAGAFLDIGPFAIATWALPHWVPNVGVRFSTRGTSLAYTGDSGPSPDIIPLALAADCFLAEATYIDNIPAADARDLGTAVAAGQYASSAGVGRLVLTHLWPGTDPALARTAARQSFNGPVDVARPGLVIDLTV